MTWTTFLEYCQAHPERIGIAVYFVVGFFVVRHIYADDADRLGREPWDRMMHVVVFGSLVAWIWPLLFLNWWMHFRQAPEED